MLMNDNELITEAGEATIDDAKSEWRRFARAARCCKRKSGRELEQVSARNGRLRELQEANGETRAHDRQRPSQVACFCAFSRSSTTSSARCNSTHAATTSCAAESKTRSRASNRCSIAKASRPIDVKGKPFDPRIAEAIGTLPARNGVQRRHRRRSCGKGLYPR